jgi:phosphoenolpyruvate carboxylase
MATKNRAKAKAARKRWSQDVTEHSDALDLQHGVFTLKDPKKLAASLKRSAEASKRRKSDPYRSAMSMLVFYINRAGKNLKEADRTRLEKAKGELRKAFGKEPAKASH